MTVTEHRTDIDVKAAIENALEVQLGAASAHVAVAVLGQAAILYGEVENERERAQALQAATSAAEHRVVVDRLDCRHLWDATDDVRLAEAAAAALAEADIPAVVPLSADVRNGIVTVRGTVSWPFQSLAARDVVAALPGVKATHNAITVVSPPMPGESEVARRIAGVLGDNLRRDLDRLEVHIQRRRVALSGVVACEDVRREAARAVEAMPGVQHVDNFIVVAPRHTEPRSALWDC